MNKDLLRLIYQRRFKLMNRWHAGAVRHLAKLGADGDLAFRSFIFNAYESLVETLRQADGGDLATTAPLFDRLEFPGEMDERAYEHILNSGIEVLEAFIREDATCRARFSDAVRLQACCVLQEAGSLFLEREVHAFRNHGKPEDYSGVLFCIKCGHRIGE